MGKDKKQSNETVNEMIDVKDIRGKLLYTKSGYVFGYLRLHPIAIDLLAEREKDNMCRLLIANFKAEREPFAILSLPRTVDMEGYLNFLVDKNESEIGSPIKKMLLNAMIREASEKVLSNNNFEHQFYIKVWAPDGQNTETIIAERLDEMARRYTAAGNRTIRLNDVDIMKLCNLYNNNNTAVMETYPDNMTYVPLPMMRRRRG